MEILCRQGVMETLCRQGVMETLCRQACHYGSSADSVYRVIQEEWPIFWKVIVLYIVRIKFI
jgi:hypothetical protein